MKLQLYPWQNECLDAWSAHGCRGILNVVTGAGKTVLALAAIERLKQSLPGTLRVKIVVPTTFLLSQWQNSILDYSDSPAVSRGEIGHTYGGRKDPADRSYMIYVINSARYCLARHILADLKAGYSVLLIADECHHYTGKENRKIFDFLPFLSQLPGQYYSLGLSATPQVPEYESILVPALGNEIYRYGFSDAAGRNTINSFAVFQIALSFNAEEAETYQDLSDRLTHSLNRLTVMYPSLKDAQGGQFFGFLNQLAQNPEAAGSNLAKVVLALTYQRKSLVCSAGSRLPCACRLIAELSPKSRIIIFGERIEQADQLYALLVRQCPGQVGCCHSKIGITARKNALERYRSGELRILVSCRALDEGFDVPSADVGIVLSSASIERQRIQRLGRILRRQEGKEVSGLYYLYLEASTEECSYLDDLPGEAYSCSLSYDSQTNDFLFPEYETAAVKVTQHFRQRSKSRKIWKEIRNCLHRGMLRPDWLLGVLLGEDVWEKKIASARTTAEKNYWVCMREMGKYVGEEDE